MKNQNNVRLNGEKRELEDGELPNHIVQRLVKQYPKHFAEITRASAHALAGSVMEGQHTIVQLTFAPDGSMNVVKGVHNVN